LYHVLHILHQIFICCVHQNSWCNVLADRFTFKS
jgi:hypothetical protein